MQFVRKVLLKVIAVTLPGVALFGCGGTEPDLEFAPLFLDSPLQLTRPITAARLTWTPTANEITLTWEASLNEITLSWDAVPDAIGYRVAGPINIVPDGGIDDVAVDVLTVTYPVPGYTAQVLEGVFQVEAITATDPVVVSYTTTNVADTEYRITGPSNIVPNNGVDEGAHLEDLTETYAVPSIDTVSLVNAFVIEGNNPAGWAPVPYTRAFVEDDAYRISGPVELIPGGSVTQSETTYEIEVTITNSDELLNAVLTVEVDNPLVPEPVSVSFTESFLFTERTIQLSWAPVDTAIRYELTQTAGYWPIMAGPEIYAPDQLTAQFPISVHLVDWVNTRFVLRAETDPDGDGTYEWEFIGEQDTAFQSRNYIAGVTPTDYLVSLGPLAGQLDYGWSVAVNELDGRFVVAGAIGEGSVPEDQRVCPEDTPDCDLETLGFFFPDSGAVYVTDTQPDDSPFYVQTKIKAPNVGFNTESGGDLFGNEVAISDDGSIFAVAAPREDSSVTGIFPVFDPDQDNDDALNSGAVYVYQRVGSDWQLDAYIKASNGAEGDEFGWDLDLSGDGNTLVVSARTEDSADDSIENAGAVYVYSRSTGAWVEEAYISAPNADSNDAFGHRVEINADGNYLAVTAIGEDGSGTDPDNNAVQDSSAVFIYELVGTDWQQVAYLKSPSLNAGNAFGQSLSFTADGSLLAIGELLEDVDGQADAGSAWLFEPGAGGWADGGQQLGGRFTASNANWHAQFGVAVELSRDGAYLAVGAWGDQTAGLGVNGNQTSDGVLGSGAVYLFERDASWVQTAYVKPPVIGGGQFSPPFFFGGDIAMALNGLFMAVSADGRGPLVFPTPEPGSIPGVVYLY